VILAVAAPSGAAGRRPIRAAPRGIEGGRRAPRQPRPDGSRGSGFRPTSRLAHSCRASPPAHPRTAPKPAAGSATRRARDRLLPAPGPRLWARPRLVTLRIPGHHAVEGGSDPARHRLRGEADDAPPPGGGGRRAVPALPCPAGALHPLPRCAARPRALQRRSGRYGRRSPGRALRAQPPLRVAK